ncbi:hypothetical protein K488DRAFT_84025 [Vararia minispora EC-137]|uniref:Uncharacterized protein n=1 Tax=Vararia minispora EC-137 TaxID=1314806 RepID=A0ACB8QRV4_9AGAM|nr:hypothetical protein K488DRAFT_84025 [Vararia minispora EC-137]
MAPKNKGKKGKKQDDDDFWEKAGQSGAGDNVPVVTTEGAESEVGYAPQSKSSSFSTFAALNVDDGNANEEEEDFGGLMSTIKAAQKGKREKKKAKPDPFEEPLYDDGDDANTEKEISVVSKAPVEMTAEELADEEWGPAKEKGKKGKKGKGKKGNVGAEEDTTPAEAPLETKEGGPAPASAPAPVADADGDDAVDDEAPKILSKKEKERLKKEKEKAKKKAQAAKKAQTAAEDQQEPTTSAIAEPAPASKPSASPAGAAEEEADEEEAVGGADAKKKKKKKKVKKDEESAPAPKKKGGANISALKALMEERKRLEEEARQKEEEERRRIEEEERRAEEEARRKEEEKQRRKEREKAKREQAKKEGRLLTKKQKEEQRAAEIRRQALLASGVQIEGLQQKENSPASAAKRPFYGKKKGPAVKSSPASSVPQTPQPPSPKELAPEHPEVALPPGEVKVDDVKSDWDASSGDEKQPVAGVKSDWDASSDEEEKPVPVAERVNGASSQKSAASKSPSKVTPMPSKTAHLVNTAPVKAAPHIKSEPAKVGPDKAAPAQAVLVKSNGRTTSPVEEEEPSSEEEGSSSEDGSSEEDSSEEDSDSESESDGMTKTERLAVQRKAEAAARRAKVHEAALAARSKDNLRSPICCILGHVDTGKTKLLDKIRQTNVQEGEAGGITQQIGATYFPVEAIKTKTAVLNKDNSFEYKVPGLLIIDTPGHESFTNLRSRGSSLCNIAILVHGLEQQTLESLRLLRDRKTPFIVALNKIDRIYGWEPTPDGAFLESLAKQKAVVKREFDDRVKKTILAFAEQGLNAVPYYENKNFARNVSLVPTSAITGEGVPDMIMLLINLTQQRMSDRLMYLSELECTVLEVKVIEGLGTTIDVVLSNGILREGDKIVLCGLNGPIVTQVRALLTPQPLRELRIKSSYVHHKQVKAALGVKIVASDLEKAIAGSRLMVVGPDDDEEDLREEVMSDLTSLLNSIDKSGRGVCVQASTLGSLEALLDFLKVSKIPVSGINIGPVHKKDVMRAATMLEKAKELACILCFDVQVDKDAERMAEEMGIRLFKGESDIIYHLFDAFTAYNAEIMEAKRRDAAPIAVWPCRLKIIACFCKRDPIILGVDILDGTLRVGTPLCAVKQDPATGTKDIIELGKITSLEINHRSMDIVKKSQAGGGVAVKIEHAVYQSAKMFGRHFDDKDEIYSRITRQSIDVLKESFKTDVSNEEWLLIKALKPRLNVQ